MLPSCSEQSSLGGPVQAVSAVSVLRGRRPLGSWRNRPHWQALSGSPRHTAPEVPYPPRTQSP